jgi:1-deoxyxylulose-5-phosphate synthase
MNRRKFISSAAAGLGATCLAPKAIADLLVLDTPHRAQATDTVVLGKTGIRTSRLAMGTGTIGSGGSSNQTRAGSLTRLLRTGYDRGLTLFDTADSYGSHPDVAEAVSKLPRDRVVIMTKCDDRDPKQAKADIDRYRRELKTDYIDILLIHCVTEGDWTTRFRGVMDVFSEAKQKGIIRAHGVSCHSIEALRAAAASPWVDVDLVRLNPVGAHMDANPQTVIDCHQGNARSREGNYRDEDSGSGRHAQTSGSSDPVRPRHWSAGCFHHRRRKRQGTIRPDQPNRRSLTSGAPVSILRFEIALAILLVQQIPDRLTPLGVRLSFGFAFLSAQVLPLLTWLFLRNAALRTPVREPWLTRL